MFQLGALGRAEYRRRYCSLTGSKLAREWKRPYCWKKWTGRNPPNHQ